MFWRLTEKIVSEWIKQASNHFAKVLDIGSPVAMQQLGASYSNVWSAID